MDDRKNLQDLCRKYFETWERKDVNGLAAMFANDIQLLDWNMSVKGMYEVLNANQKIFDSVSNLKVQVMDMVQDDICPWKVVCMLLITVNDGLPNVEYLRVIDVISFNQEDKIDLIDAYTQTVDTIDDIHNVSDQGG